LNNERGIGQYIGERAVFKMTSANIIKSSKF